MLDWDAFLGPAGALAGVAVPPARHTWSSYERLVRTIVEQVGSVPVVLLGVCTPEQLKDWPDGDWLLLDTLSCVSGLEPSLALGQRSLQ